MGNISSDKMLLGVVHFPPHLEWELVLKPKGLLSSVLKLMPGFFFSLPGKIMMAGRCCNNTHIHVR